MSHDENPEQNPGTLGSPDLSRGGSTVDEAVANAEQGSHAEGDHVPSGQAASGESRVEQMPEVVEAAEETREEQDVQPVDEQGQES